MSTPPNLLDDDGNASMATAIMSSHHGFRRDLAQFATALRRLAAGDRQRVAALREEWTHFRGKLHAHHQAEDTGLFPSLRAQQPALAAVIAGLDADHRRIDPLLEQGDRAFAALPVTTEAAAEIVALLRALLAPHLATEEAQLFPFLRGAKEFPSCSDDELAMFADGFAWCSHGIAPDIIARLDAILPPALVARLPAARAAFTERCARVWGSAQPGASRTAVPDWIE